MRKARNAVKPLGGPRDPRHGTECGYGYWGCRCGPCRTGAAERAREMRNGENVTSHGRYGYDMGCRCAVCKTGKREEEQVRRLAIKDWKRTHQHGKTVTTDLSRLA